MSVSRKAPRGGIAPCWGIAGMAEKVSRDRGYRSDTIAISRDMGPLSLRADFWEGDEDSNFSIFRVRRFSEWPEPLH